MFFSSKALRAIEKREGMAHWGWPQFVMTHEMCSTCSTYPQIRKDGIIQTSPMAAMDRFKDPPKWLKVATTQEIDLQPWAPHQWTSTTTRWRCGLILLPSLTLRSPHPQGNRGRQGHIHPTSINQSIKSSFVKGAGAHPQNAPCRRHNLALRSAPVPPAWRVLGMRTSSLNKTGCWWPGDTRSLGISSQ